MHTFALDNLKYGQHFKGINNFSQKVKKLHKIRVKFMTISKLFFWPPEGTEEPVKIRDVGDGVYECDYYPILPGKYVVTITWGGIAIPRRWA